MKRRTFFGGLLASVASLFGISKAAAVEPQEGMARIFLFGEDEKFREIPRGTEKPGDRILMLGLDDGEVWRLCCFTVDENGCRIVDGKPTVHTKHNLDILGKIIKPQLRFPNSVFSWNPHKG